MDVLNFVQNLERKKFYNYLAIFFVIFCLIIAGIIFFQYRKTSKSEERLQKINQSRGRAQTILKSHAFVKEQQKRVKEILEKDQKEFIITEFFDDVVKNLGLSAKRKESAGVAEVSLNNGYKEEQLPSSFKDMNMRDVVRLLNEIEQKERVYVKKVELLKSPKGRSLEVNLVIATLRPKVES